MTLSNKSFEDVLKERNIAPEKYQEVLFDFLTYFTPLSEFNRYLDKDFPVSASDIYIKHFADGDYTTKIAAYNKQGAILLRFIDDIKMQESLREWLNQKQYNLCLLTGES